MVCIDYNIHFHEWDYISIENYSSVKKYKIVQKLDASGETMFSYKPFTVNSLELCRHINTDVHSTGIF